MTYPFVDIFAGPGGLGEGFSAFVDQGAHPFKPVLSIEKEKRAHETLKLRSFFRYFRHTQRPIPKQYYDCLRGQISTEDLYSKWPDESLLADAEAKCIELGGKGKNNDPVYVNELISEVLDGSKKWVLLGGPPCQAYSLVGRSRMGGINENDPRVNLYKHYLWILANHQPAAFVFENVTGLASSKVKDRAVFNEIIDSLCSPKSYLRADKNFKVNHRKKDLGYSLYGLSPSSDLSNSDLFEIEKIDINSVVIKSEKHGIPQARHRIIIIGIRKDLDRGHPGYLDLKDPVPVEDVIGDLPRLRGGLSKENDGGKEWLDVFKRMSDSLQINSDIMMSDVIKKIKSVIVKMRCPKKDRGGEFVVSSKRGPNYENGWYFDESLGGVCNHTTRSHLTEDLYRYIYAAVYAQVNKDKASPSPKLQDFPEILWPKHKNTQAAISEGLFNDRFRVQPKGRPATTVTSHISKDGHYFIHYDPTQARSLTVREAARIQTFPDNYFFCGPRTSQYTQVGNAVPPLLASKVAKVVYESLSASS